MKKVLALLLTLLMLLPLVACSKDKKQPDGNNQSVTTSGGNETLSYLDSLPQKDYEGYEFNVLCTSQTAAFYDVTENSKDTVASSVYQRNLAVNEKYKINLLFKSMDGNKTGSDDFNMEIRSSVQSGDDGYDLIVGQAYYSLPLAAEGMLYDLKSTEYLHWDEPWYSSKINDNGEIKGKLYGASGSFIMSQISYAMGLFYNKSMFEDRQFNVDLYQLVREKKWTYEKLYQFTSGYYEDLNSDGRKDNDDLYGYVYNIHSVNASLVGSDCPVTSVNAQGKVTLANYYNAHLSKVFDTYYTYYNDTKGVRSYKNDFDPAIQLGTRKALFASAQLGVMNDCPELRSCEDPYGVLPMPLYDENQTDYYTYTMRWELFYIPTNADIERSSIILEYLNYTSEQYIIPAYWENALSTRAADTEDDSEMLYMIRDNLYYDFATFYNDMLGGIRDAVAGLIKNGSSRLSSWWGTNSKAYENSLDALLDSYD